MHGGPGAAKLETMRFSRLVEELNEQERTRVKQIDAEMAQRGLSNSGPRLQAISQARSDKIKQIIDGRIQIRKELCHGFPELCSDNSLTGLLTQLSAIIGNAFAGLRDNLGPQVATAFQVRDQQEEYQLRAYANREIAILKEEIALKLHQKPASPPVSVTTLAGASVVNLGTIYGGVKQVIHAVDRAGLVDLANSLETLVSAIRDAEGLGFEQAAFLEQVSVCSGTSGRASRAT